jgi:lipopolysaccharide export system permease protein
VKRLDLYLLRAIMGAVVLVVAIFVSLGALFLFMQQQDDIGVGSYSWVGATAFVLLNLPEQIWQLLPVTAMIGALVGLGALARGSELTIMRAAGFSVWRVARTAALAGVLLAAGGAALSEWLAPATSQFANQQKTFAKYAQVRVTGSAGAWVRDGRWLVNMDRPLRPAARDAAAPDLGDMLFVELTPEFRLASVARASAATAVAASAGPVDVSANGWALARFAETRFETDAVRSSLRPEHRFVTTLSPEILGASSTTPARMSISALYEVMRYMDRNGLDSREWTFAFWTRVARIAAVVFAVMLAVPFVFGSQRSSGGGSRAMLGVAVGVGFFLLQSLLENGVLVFELDPALVAWVPTALLGAAALALTATTR